MRVVALVCVLLCLHATALPLSDDGDTVVLVPSQAQCDINSEITVSYQRLSTERESSEKLDYIGLFRKADSNLAASFDVALVKESAQTGSVTIRCRKPGMMQLRMIRNPGKIIGRVDLTVFAPCPRPDCSNHGRCEFGVCLCDNGWEGNGCELLKGDGASIGWEGNDEGEFYIGDKIHAKIHHTATEPHSSGADFINVMSVSAPKVALASDYIPAGETSVDIQLPTQPGAYFLQLYRGADGNVIAVSKHFNIYPLCPNQCNYHGACKEGKCVCDTDFDRDDCSRGPGIVHVNWDQEAYGGQVLSVNFTRDETVQGVLTDYDFIGVYRASDESCDNPEYFAFAIADRIYDPDVRAKLETNFTTGTVQLIMPLEPGDYVIKYVRQDHAKYFVSDPFKVFQVCPRNCSAHGHCSEGKCICDDGWQGSDCSNGTSPFSLSISGSIDDLYVYDVIKVKFSRPAGLNTDYDFIGVYAEDSANNTDQLYSYGYAISSITEDVPTLGGEVELQLSAPGKMVIRYVNAYSLDTEVELETKLEVFNTCPNNCSEHGKCVKGKCVCDEKWKSDDCSKGVGSIELSPTSGSPVTLKTTQVGFQVHVKRPAKHYNAGDFIALFNAAGPFEADKNVAYSYAKYEDESDVFLIANSVISRKASGAYVLKYFNPVHEELGTSDAFDIEIQDE